MILPWCSSLNTQNQPGFGSIHMIFARFMVRSRAMLSTSVPADLLDHLVRTRGLSRSEARRIVEEVVSFYGETAEAFVTRRHRELQAEGLRNRAIYARIAEELEGRRFRAPRLSERQIRRIVYG